MNRKSLIVSLFVLAVAAACSSGVGGSSPSPPGSSGAFNNPSASGASNDPSASGAPNDPNNPANTPNGGAADDGTAGYARPYLLTPLSVPRTNTANISLVFSVVDAKGIGVANLVPKEKKADDVFDAFEDGLGIDLLESDFQVKALTGQLVTIPTVILLDLSGSVVNGGALETLKKAASTIVDAMLPEQRIALLSFADIVTTRSPFTADKVALKKAIDGINSADGLSTNLYGALIQGLGMWQDGFAGGAGGGQLTAGLAIVITDGADTAAIANLNAVMKARGNKRVVAVAVGPEVNAGAAATAMDAIASTGTVVKRKSFADLDANLVELTTQLQTLNRSIYQANYCSPKRAGDHNLLFTVKGNGASASAACTSAVFSNACSIASSPEYTENCGQQGTTSICCPTNAPYHCPNLTSCFASAEAAAAECPDACTHCGGTGQPNQTSFEGGTAIRVAFMANGYQSQQCPAFYGPECKSTGMCCDTLPPAVSTQCAMATESASGNEAQCTGLKNKYCRELGTECTKAVACCSTFGNTVSVQCWNQAQGVEASCTNYVASYCMGNGPNCTALRNCCQGLQEPERSACEQNYISVNQDEASCLASKPASCP